MQIRPDLPSHPNVIVLIVDDLAHGDLRCHGNPHTQTPALDRLHGESVNFTRHCSGPLCTPARAALFTGRHPFRTRAYDTYLARSNLDSDERTLAMAFREAGYTTGLFGKWHLGDLPPNDPNSMGFDHLLYHTGGGLRQPANAYGRNSYFDPELIRDGRRVATTGYCTDIFMDSALEFINEADRPFFCYLGFNAVHSPFEIVEHWADHYRALGLPEVWCRLYGMLKNLDDNIGRLLDHLDSSGRRRDTIVLFTADHGPCASANHEGQPRFNGVLRGIKGGFYEGGVKVPAFWSWPAAWSARDVDVLTNPIDVFPTLAEVCGLDLPADRVIDGQSLAPQLTGTTPNEALTQRSICMQWHRGARPVRGQNAACIGPRYKWYSVTPSQVELYDLHLDPSEKDNLAASRPDLIQSMGDTYHRWFDDVCGERDLLDPDVPPDVPIVIGDDSGHQIVLTWQDWTPYSGAEGFSTGNPGSWSVDVRTAGVYRVIVDREPATHNATLHFQFTDRTVLIPPQPKVETLCFETELPAGANRLHCYFERAESRTGPLTVSIKLIKRTVS